MRKFAVYLALSGGLIAGCMGAPEDAVESSQQPIIDGVADTGDPSMVEMFAFSKRSRAKCTCTLVSPRVLLTAAHCVFETKGATYAVFPGNDDQNIVSPNDKGLLPVKAAEFDPQYNDQDVSAGHDLGVIVLASPVALPVIPMNRALPASAKGQPVRVVGYGLTDGVQMTGDGVKRAATSKLDAFDDTLIRVANNAHNTCQGDSGGPLLMDTGKGEAIIGTVSFGAQFCNNASFFMRLDTQIAWVDEMIKKYDPDGIPPSGGGTGNADGGASPSSDGGTTPVTPDAAPPPPPDAAPLPPDAPPPPPPDAAPQPPATPDPTIYPMAVDAGRAAPVRTALSGGCGCDLGGGPARGGPLGVVTLAGLALLVRRRRA